MTAGPLYGDGNIGLTSSDRVSDRRVTVKQSVEFLKMHAHTF